MKKNKNIKTGYKLIILLSVISLLLGGIIYISTNSFLELADAQITPLIKAKLPEAETPKETIARVAESEGLNKTLTLMISEMESKLDPHFLKVNRNGSVDRGIFAFNNKAYPEVSNECSFSPECATRKFAQEVKKGHLRNWLTVRGFRIEIFEKYLLNKNETEL